MLLVRPSTRGKSTVRRGLGLRWARLRLRLGAAQAQHLAEISGRTAELTESRARAWGRVAVVLTFPRESSLSNQ